MLDLKSLPVGTIAINIRTKNRYVVLMKNQNRVTYYSDKEGFALKIKTKPLSVNIEFKPESKYSAVTRIEDIPKEIYTDEQNKFIEKALKKWKR